MPRPVHFELAVDDPDRAARFYGDVFGWTTQKWESPGGDDWGYWLVGTGPDGEPGIDGAFQKRDRQADAWMNVIGVESIDESIAKVQAAGGSIALDKMPVPGQGWAAYAMDSEGNTFGMFESDPSVGVGDAGAGAE